MGFDEVYLIGCKDAVHSPCIASGGYAITVFGQKLSDEFTDVPVVFDNNEVWGAFHGTHANSMKVPCG